MLNQIIVEQIRHQFYNDVQQFCQFQRTLEEIKSFAEITTNNLLNAAIGLCYTQDLTREQLIEKMIEIVSKRCNIYHKEE